jgi:hypothetical protein|tara:strand:- start:1062 stop:1394 length:333 start_codon:yes stop_codon:yes gene_type:complete
MLVFSCKNQDKPNKKVWVYLETYYITKNDTTANYCYGKIHQSDLNKIKSQGDSKGMFELTDGRYLDDDQKVHDYSDSEESGVFFFRFKDVVYIEIQKQDPLNVSNDRITD